MASPATADERRESDHPPHHLAPSPGLRRGVKWALLLSTWLPTTLWAAPPVIEAGRERDVLALVAPFQDEGEISGGVVIAGIRVRGDRVEVLLALGRPPTEVATLSLRPLDPEAGRAAGASFRIVRPQQTSAPMGAAADAVIAAIRANDDGRFFPLPADPAEEATSAQAGPAQADKGADVSPTGRHPRVPMAEIDADFNLWRQPGTMFAVGLWLVLLLALAVRMAAALGAARSPGRRAGLGTHILLLALTVTVAMLARQATPLTPLHANHHAFDDLSVTLDLADSGPSTQRAVRAYGPSWLVAQRVTTALFGRHHAGVGAAAVWWGALAVALCLAAGWAAGGTGWPLMLAAMAMALAPVAVRVGHSESTLVIGQWLVAATLALASRRSSLATAGTLAGVLLLATGHVVGPALAGGTALLAWSMPPPRARSADHSAPQRRAAKRDLWRLGALILAPVLGAIIHLQGSSGEVADRVAATGSWLPIPGNPNAFSLWFDQQQAPLGLLLLVGLGVLGLSLRRGARRSWYGRAEVASAVAGVFALGAGGLLVCASVSDGLRYQATLAPALVVVAGQAVHLQRRTRGLARFAGRTALALVGVLILLPLTSPLPGLQRLDAQGQWYGHLRTALAHETGPVYLLIAGRGGPRGAVFQAPQGQLWADGPVAIEVRQDSVSFECQAGLALRQPLYVLFPPACASGPDAQAALACAALEPYVDYDRPMVTGLAWPLKAASDEGIPGEFLRYRGAVVPWRVARGRCPQSP